MARIRTIKPKFWTDGKMVQCSFAARLLFIGLWNFADDNGNLERSSEEIKMQIFPGDNVDCETLLMELITQGVVIEYSVNARKFLHIRNFLKHQVINRKSTTNLPDYDNSNDSTISYNEKLPYSCECIKVKSVSTHGVLTECSVSTHGRKGKERKGISLLENTNVFPKSSPPLQTKKNSDFETFWKEYPKSGKGCGKNDAKRAYEKAISSGVSHNEILTAIQHYVVYLGKTGIHPAYASKWLKDQRWTVDYQEVLDEKKHNLPDHSKTVCSCQKHFGQGINTPEKRAQSYAWYRKKQPGKYQGEMQRWLESYEQEHGMVA